MKLACVIHRFGGDVAGGSEAHCRAIAGRLAARHDISVLTTTSRDHVTWAEAYPSGVSADGPLRVHRFPVARPRSLHRFFEASEVAFGGAASEADEIQWFRENGPETPALLEYLEAHGAEYDRVLFWSYRYYQSFFGLPLVAPRAVLVPTAEEDPAIALDVLDRYFSLPSGYVFLTPEERDLVSRRCSQPLAPSCIVMNKTAHRQEYQRGSGASSRHQALWRWRYQRRMVDARYFTPAAVQVNCTKGA
jgi:hypothetical protein